MLTPKRYLESSLQLRYHAGCLAMHLCGLRSEGCVVWIPAHYRLVVGGAYFLRLSFCLELDISYSKT